MTTRSARTFRHARSRGPALALGASLILALASGHAAGIDTLPQQPASGTPVAGTPSSGAPADRLALTTERVIIFKNGYCLVIKSAKGRADARGDVYFSEVPPAAVLGTFWVTSPEHQVKSVRATTTLTGSTQTVITRPQNFAELAAANLGRPVTLQVVGQSRPQYEGTLVQLLDGQSVPVPGASGDVLERIEPGTPPRPDAASHVVIKEQSGNLIALPIASITAMQDPHLLTEWRREAQSLTSEKRLVISMGPELADREVNLSIVYFTPGMRWIPTYRLQNVGEPAGRLELQGEILNELEDFEGVPADLVVGVPSFRFKDVVSPLSLEPVLYNALNEAAPQIMGQQAIAGQFRNDYYADRAGERLREAVIPAGLPDPAEEGVGAGEQDLHVYPIGPLTMKRGDRAAIPLWATTQPIAHVYTFDVNVRRDQHGGCTVSDNYNAADSSRLPLQLASNRVWHQLELKNASTVPWTTGATIVFDGRTPISQELLTYTSPGGTTLLPLTVATDLRGSYAEEEINREANVLRWGSNQYSRLTKRCTITLTSFRQEASSMRIGVSMGGRAKDASDAAKVAITDSLAADWSESWWAPVNNHSSISWSLDLKPGETKTLTFVVEYYVP